MRIVILACAVALCSAAPLAAQERQFGAKVGPAIATLAIEPSDDGGYKRRGGAAGGGFYVLPLASGLAIQFEGLYVQKGGKLEIEGIQETAAILLDYLEFPVLLRLGPSRRAPRGVHALAGLSGGIRVTARRQFSVALGGFTSGEAIDIGDEIERFEASFIAGAGIDIHPRIVVDGRYSWGLTPVNRDRSDGFRVRTRVLAIMAGVRF